MNIFAASGQDNIYKQTKKQIIMKRLLMAVLMLTAMVTVANAQSSKKDKDKVYEVVDKLPEYPGGIPKLMEFIGKNVKYPKEAVARKEEGRVMVSFIVDTDGRAKDVSVVKNVSPALDSAAVAVVKKMPKWKPGQIKKKKVRVKMNIPVSFKLH